MSIWFKCPYGLNVHHSTSGFGPPNAKDLPTLVADKRFALQIGIQWIDSRFFRTKNHQIPPFEKYVILFLDFAKSKSYLKTSSNLSRSCSVKTKTVSKMSEVDITFSPILAVLFLWCTKTGTQLWVGRLLIQPFLLLGLFDALCKRKGTSN